MPELSADEMANIWGRLGYRDAFDSCNDPDGSEIYAHWAAQEAYLDYREATRAAEIIKVSVYNAYPNQAVPGSNLPNDEIIKVSLAMAGANRDRASTPAEARQQAETCKIDPLFSNMINLPQFFAIQESLISASRPSFLENGINYYGNGNFGGLYTSRLQDKVYVGFFDIVHLLYGKADVFIHTHPAIDAMPGLSKFEGDIDLANNLGIGIMAIDISELPKIEYYCYNPNTPDYKGVL
jgi:hypothetical protein